MLTDDMLGKYKYVNSSENSDKFWHIIHDRSRGVCIAKWGRNGRPPQGTKEYTLAEAVQKIKQKRKKGYEKIEGSLEAIGSNAIAFIKGIM